MPTIKFNHDNSHADFTYMSEEQQTNPPAPVTITLKDGTTMQRVVDLFVKKKPTGWSRRSYASYYKKRYAEWIKKDIDAMIADRQPKVYRKDLWPNVSITSLYLRVNQAIRYLTDPENGMDPADRYKIWLEDVKIGYIPRRGYPKIGVSMSFDEVLEGAEPRAETYIAEADMPVWKIKMDDWLEDGDAQEPFHVSNLLLTPQQQEQIRLELGGLENIAFSVSSREIKIIKS